MSSVADKIQWGVTVVCALAAVSALLLARYYKTEVDSLTRLRTAEAARYEQSYEIVTGLLDRERQENEERVRKLEHANRTLLTERDWLHDNVKRLQASLDAATAEECCRRSKDFVGFSDRAYDIATRCTAELGKKQQALETCVRMYEDVKIVNDRSK